MIEQRIRCLRLIIIFGDGGDAFGDGGEKDFNLGSLQLVLHQPTEKGDGGIPKQIWDKI